LANPDSKEPNARLFQSQRDDQLLHEPNERKPLTLVKAGKTHVSRSLAGKALKVRIEAEDHPAPFPDRFKFTIQSLRLDWVRMRDILTTQQRS